MKIALLTCEKLPDLMPADQLLIPPLNAFGIDAKAVVWDAENVDWNEFDYLIFRNTWDYFEKENKFNAWLDHIDTLGIKTLNPIPVIRQNKHKFYLRNLQSKGIQVLPTIYIDRTDNLNLAELIPLHWKKAVIKPAFSAGSYLTEAFEVNVAAEINERYKEIAINKELLVQEFRPEITASGETSFIFFNKKFSHCVNKKPADGDFRVQFQFGGQYQLIEPSIGLISQAQQVVDTFESELLYARVDGIIINDELFLMEVECIEPDLYLNLKEGLPEQFAQEIMRSISN